jgi:hypothetical protein
MSAHIDRSLNLSFVSKMVELVVVSRFDEHVETQHLLPDRQSALRQRSLQCTILSYERSIQVTCVHIVLLDPSSAFDTVDHETLIHVLQQRFGVEGPALTWFGSYLCD